MKEETIMKLIEIAQNTVEILNTGYYYSVNHQKVNLTENLTTCINGTQYYIPDVLIDIEQNIQALPPQFEQTEFDVRNETTLIGTERLAKTQQLKKIGVLNFASAKNPGGGFLKGSQAQEESLARSSGLYKSLILCQDYYSFHRHQKSGLYSNRMIYSPSCPVFKTDEGTLLDSPYLVDFLTSPAPNAGAIANNNPEDINQIQDVFYDRASKLLSVFAKQGCDALVLGAWGCGVFKNDPVVVSKILADLLWPDRKFYGRFKTVLFSILDNTKTNFIISPFYTQFKK
jgi:uncharacterized protein (TIGR02452 family)